MSNRFVQNASTQGFAFKHNIIAAIANAHSVDIAVSYLKMTGWYMLSAALGRISPVRIRILTTDQMNVTQPAVLRAALRSGIQIRCYCGNRVYHPKVYLLHGVARNKNIAILGSANISGSGLQSGIEAGIQISDPILFRQLAKWFDAWFCDPASQQIDKRFIKEYEDRWKPAASARVPLRGVSGVRRGRDIAPTPEDLDTLDDAFSTITLPVGTLGFDQAANNIRNLSRLLEVIGRYPNIGSKERSELRLLGFMQSGRLSALGRKARGCRTTAAVAKLWSSWLKKTPNAALNSINRRLRVLSERLRDFGA
jgi:HKD family nuclease